MVRAEFPVERLSPNGAVYERLIVVAYDPEEARHIAAEHDWTVTRCGAASWGSPAYYDTTPFIKYRELGRLPA